MRLINETVYTNLALVYILLYSTLRTIEESLAIDAAIPKNSLMFGSCVHESTGETIVKHRAPKTSCI